MRSLYAIDLGTSAIKCARLVRRGRTVRVASFVTVPVEPDQGERGALAQLVEKQGLKGKTVAISLPASLVHIRNVDSPLLRERLLRKTIKAQVEPLVPVDVDAAVVDFTRLTAPDPSPNTVHLLVAVAPREVVAEKMALLQSVGLRVHSISIDAMDNCAAARALLGAKGRALVADLGARTCNLALLDDGGPAQIRVYRVGIAGLGAGAPDGTERYARKVAEEITRMIKGTGGGRPDQILLTGGGSLAADVREALAALLGSAVMPTDLAARFMPGADEDTQKALNGLGMTAFGAAYSILAGAGPLMDLRREEFAPPGMLARVRKPLMLCAAAALIACLAGNVPLFLALRSAHERAESAGNGLLGLWNRLYPSLPPPPDISSRLEEDCREIAAQKTAALLPQRQSAIDLLLGVVKQMPREKIGEVRQVHVSQNSVEMDIQTSSFSAPQDIAQSINKDPRFSASVKDLKPIRENVFSFQLVVAVRSEAAHG